jgi:hypothetical protein
VYFDMLGVHRQDGGATVQGVGDGEWVDCSVLEVVSWRLASELSRRHPHTTRMFRAHPGGGLSDCLWLRPANGGPGDVRLNRAGTIQVLERFDGRDSAWPPTSWDDYIRADPKSFLLRLEAEAGLPAPTTVPASTPRTLTLRVLATMAATGVKSIEPIEIASGMIDTSGEGGGTNCEAFDAFTAIPGELLEPLPGDLFGQPEYRFWFVVRGGDPILAFEQDRALAWTRHHHVTFSVMDLYRESRRHLLVTALKLLRRVDHI